MAESTTEKNKRKNVEKSQKNKQITKNIKNKLSFKFNDVKNHLVLIEHSKGVGSGFIANDEDGNTYVYTNQHVVMACKKLKMKTIDGERLTPIGFDAALKRDIIRFKLKKNEPALKFNKNPAIGNPVAVFGNSAGGGVATEIYGKVTGVGPDKIEVSARFVCGNSGSPVLDKDKNVIGVATYVTRALDKNANWEKDGTRFAEPRYFAYSVNDSIKWKKIKWKKYIEMGNLILKDKAFIKTLGEMARAWAVKPYSEIDETVYKHLTLRSWAKSHNKLSNKHFRQLEKGSVRSANKLNRINDSIRNAVKKDYTMLANICNRESKKISMQIQRKKKYLTGFLIKKMEENKGYLDFLSKCIEKHCQKVAAGNAFYLKETQY